MQIQFSKYSVKSLPILFSPPNKKISSKVGRRTSKNNALLITVTRDWKNNQTCLGMMGEFPETPRTQPHFIALCFPVRVRITLKGIR